MNKPQSFIDVHHRWEILNYVLGSPSKEDEVSLKDIFGATFESVAKEQIGMIKEISEHIEGINTKVEKMTEERKKANALSPRGCFSRISITR